VFGGNSDSNAIKPLMQQQQGGQRKGGQRKGGQKGGYWAQVINNAIVPLTLFALNKHAHNKSKKSMYGNGAARTMKRMR
jgi:hypothetical protein